MNDSTHPRWPAQGDHLFGKWFFEKKETVVIDGKSRAVITQWRRCIHPDCRKVETREAPKA